MTSSLLQDVLTAGFSDPEAGWSMGSFGAIAEFHHVEGDTSPELLVGYGVVSARGGVRLDNLHDVIPVAWEALSPRPDRWQQGVSLCLNADAAAMSRRDSLTEIGPDRDAIRPQDRDAILFDMGLDQPQVDFCIRTADADLIAILREHSGRSISDPDNPSMAAILKAHPHRVALSRIGRVEVYQMIGGPDTGGVSPTGPHTHVLPKLLKARRSHSANTPIPQGLIPVAGFHPASPIMDRLAGEREFDPAAFADFQSLFAVWGSDSSNRIKQLVWDALSQGREPSQITEPDDRFGRIAFRVALRQYGRQHGETATLSLWRSAFDREFDQADADEDAPGH